MKKKKDLQKKEIFWNIANSMLAGGISFFSALLAAGEVNAKIVGISVTTACLVALNQFKGYWEKEEKEYKEKKLGAFLG